MIQFGKTLRQLRLENGMSQKQLGEIFNVDQTTIKDWEIRGREPSYETLYKLAKFFEVRLEELLGVEEY